MKNKKIISLSLLIVMSLLISFSMINVSAKEINTNFSTTTETEFELNLDELSKGVDFIAYYTESGNISIIKDTDKPKTVSAKEIAATFSVTLTKIETGRAILSWTATAHQLKNVTGTIYCRDTNVISPKTYCNSSIVCPYLNGTEGRASQATSSFGVSYKQAAYRVGYSNVSLRTITSSYYFGNGSSVVTK